MKFHEANGETFCAKLRQSGFYAEWKGKFGDEAWAILERNTKTLV